PLMNRGKTSTLPGLEKSFLAAASGACATNSVHTRTSEPGRKGPQGAAPSPSSANAGAASPAAHINIPKKRAHFLVNSILIPPFCASALFPYPNTLYECDHQRLNEYRMYLAAQSANSC